MRRLIFLLFAMLAGCNPRGDNGPVVVSVIGATPALADPDRGPLDSPSRLLLDASAQGLVRFDAGGAIEPGLAERWIVIDGGLSYIFRLREAEWADGRAVTADAVARILRRAIAPTSRNPLRPFLSAIEDVVEMTPRVIEVRLSRPRPDLLRLFAQPELAIVQPAPGGGSGPFRIAGGARPGLMLRPAFDPVREGEDDVREPGPAEMVQLIGERASRALLRFKDRRSDLVTGGTFASWPLIGLARIAPANVRLDPAAGLFGLAVTRRQGFLAAGAGRAAIAGAIDRRGLLDAFSGNWAEALRLLPDQLDSARPPATPLWATRSRADRLADAAAAVRDWRRDHADPIRLGIAMPRGPGATLLFGLIAADLKQIGIDAVRVAPDAEADLKLIDAVAPYDSARWYLGTACQLCGPIALAAIAAARDAASLDERARYLAAADAAMAADIAFIPLAQPLRWSLVSLRLGQWQPNSRAWHPLNRLRIEPTS